MKRSKKSIKQTKNGPLYIRNGNESFKLVMLSDDLPWTIRHQLMIIIIINNHDYSYN